MLIQSIYSTLTYILQRRWNGLPGVGLFEKTKISQRRALLDVSEEGESR